MKTLIFFIGLEGYKKATELKDKQLADIKKIHHGARKSFDSVVQENKELKRYIENTTQRYQQYQQQQQQNYIKRKREYLRKKPQKI